MSIFDAIMALTRRKDPVETMKDDIITSSTGGGAVPAPQPGPDGGGQPAPQQDPNAPPPPESQPKAYQSPPDLSALYMELMNRDRVDRQFEQGKTLIAASLARDENRDRIMKTYPDMQDTPQASMFNTLGLLQKQQQEMLVKNQLRLAIPRIAKEHNLSLEDAYTMFENGQLEEYLKSVDAPERQVVESADGSKRVLDLRQVLQNQQQPATTPPAPPASVVADDGTPVPTPRPDPNAPAPPTPDQTIAAAQPGVVVAPAKPKDVEYVDDGTGTGNKVAVWKGTTDRVDGKGKVLTQPVTRKIEYKPGATPGSQTAFDQAGERVPEKDVPGTDELEIKEDANGQFQVWNKTKGVVVGTPVGAKKDDSTDDMKEWAQAKMAAEARGETFPPWDDWLKELTAKRDPKPTSSNYDPVRKVQYPDPPTDTTYLRDKDGNFVMDAATNMPKIVPMPGTKLATEQADVQAKAKAQVESKQQAAGVVAGMVDKSIAIMDDESMFNPATGALAPLASFIEGSNRARLEESLSPIKAAVAFDALAEMRRNSPTGGALGNVSDIELRLLASTLGSLEPRQGKESLKENLRFIKEIVGGNSKKALEEWRKKYNPNGKDMTPEEKAAADKAFDEKSAAGGGGKKKVVIDGVTIEEQ